MNNSDSSRSEIYRITLSLAQVNDARVIAFNMIPPNSTVLDVGCACGDFGVLLKQHKNCTVHGVEYDSNSLRIAGESHAYASLTQLDLESQNPFTGDFAGLFDVIAVLDVLEHLAQPLEVLRSLKHLLKPQGFFVISLPNIAFGEIKLKLFRNEFTYTDLGILDKTHLRFFTYRSIAALATDSGLRISKVLPKLADFTGTSRESPRFLKALVAMSLHSFVFQYVLTAHTTAPSDSLITSNFDQMSNSVGQQGQSINRLRRLAWKNILLPFGSTRHKLVKRLFQVVRKSGA